MNLNDDDLHVLRNCELLKQLPEDCFQKVLNFSEVKTYQKDEALLKEDELSDNLFVIISGSVGLYKANKKPVLLRNITSLGVGESIGEMRIIKNRPCVLTVTANEPTKVLQIPLSSLRSEKYHESHNLLGPILEIMNNRIIKTNSNILDRINEKIRKMRQLSFAFLIIVVLTFFFLELFFAMFYFTNTESFCNFQDKLTGTEHYEGKM